MGELVEGLDLGMTMVDLARLAKVRRPVVSVWRSRPAPTPFPEPLPGGTGEERFDADAVVDWLERTGRGNNPNVRADAAAFAWPLGPAARDDATVFNGVMALLCLRELAARKLGDLDSDELLDLAEDADPDDEYLLGEVDTLGARRVALARFADALADAAYTNAEAIESLMAERFRFAMPGHADVACAPVVGELVASLAAAVAVDADLTHATLVDPTQGASDLILTLLRREDTFADARVLLAAHDDDASRQARRRLLVKGTRCAPLTIAADGSWAVSGPALHLARYPSPGRPVMTPVEILNAVEQIVLQMDDTHRAIVLAPAEVLTDQTRDSQTEFLRDDLLRQGRVRAIVRLPQGLVPSRSRQALGLWVLGPAYPQVPIVDRRTMVADLTDLRLDPATCGDLVGDLVVSMGGRDAVRAHAFRFAHPVLTRNLVTGGDLVTRRRPTSRLDREAVAKLAIQFDELVSAVGTAETSTGLDRIMVEIRESGENTAPILATLGELVEERHIRVVAGNRLELEAMPHGTVPVIGPEELTGDIPMEHRGVDRLRFTEDCPAGRYTEPGDVVFCTAPYPAALVDVEGASVVLAPARVLRVNRQVRHGVVPWLLAEDINTQPAEARAWRLWPVRQVPPAERAAVGEVLATIERQRARTLHRLTKLDELTNVVTLGVSTGTLHMKIAKGN